MLSWVRAALVIASVSMVLARTAPVRAADEPRRDWYTALAFGPAFVAGSVDYSGETAKFRDEISGGGGALLFAMGYAPADGLAVALEVGASITHAEVRVPDGSRDFFSVWSAGALVDWYPRPSGPVHLQLGLGYTVSTFLAGGTDHGGGQKSQPGLGGDGVIGRAGVGYVFRSGSAFELGPLLSLSTLRTSNAAATTEASGVALLLQLSWF